MSRWKVTEIPLVPSMILQLANAPEWAKADISSIEYITCGAALLPPELLAKLQSKVKSTFFEGYGSSESVRVSLSPFPHDSGESYISVDSRRPS